MIADQYETEEDTVWAPVMGEARVVVVAASMCMCVCSISRVVEYVCM